MRKQTKIAAMVSAAALLAIGASMTSFAAWNPLSDGSWEYLDKYGDRVYNEWKKYGADWFYLGDDGIMVTDELLKDTDDTGNIYYVNEAGVRVANQWVSVDNEEDETVGDAGENLEVDTLWYYFDSKGRAYKGDGAGDYKVKKLPYGNGSEANFLFDAEGHMMSGWVTRTYLDAKGDEKNDIYYLGDENEGWALTGWQYLEPNEDSDHPYDDEKWFHFGSNGKADKGGTKYIDGHYFRFDAYGAMEDSWWATTTSTASTAPYAYAADNGYMGTGWVKTTAQNDPDGSAHWYYLINNRDSKGKVIGTVPFNYGGAGNQAKSIKGKTYLFDNAGIMLTGVKPLDEIEATIDGSKELAAGTYYFNKTSGSTEGQMMTGRVTVEEDGESYYYHFRKDGRAYVNGIKDGILYGEDGKRIQAEDGNSYRIVEVKDATIYKKDDGTDAKISGEVAVNSNGRVKTSGNIKIDDVTYIIDYKADGGTCSVTVK